MSFTINYGSIPSLPEMDQSECGCDYECGTVGYCLKECGESYIINTLLADKGYRQANYSFGYLPGEKTPVPGIELYKRQAKKFINNMKQLGYDCTVYHPPMGKKYLDVVIIENGIDPMSVAHEFLKLDVIK